MEAYVNVRGWVGTPVELRETGKGSVAKFRIAATSRYRRDGEWVDGNTTWFSVDAWRALGTNAACSLRKGDPVLVSGRLRTERWTADDGRERESSVIEASAIGHDLNRGKTFFARVKHADEAGDETGEAPAELDEDEAVDDDDVDAETGEIRGSVPVS